MIYSKKDSNFIILKSIILLKVLVINSSKIYSSFNGHEGNKFFRIHPSFEELCQYFLQREDGIK